MVFMNSCDAMRRLSDAWQNVCPDVESMLIDLPSTVSETSAGFFTKELTRVCRILEQWSGTPFDPERLMDSIRTYNGIAGQFQRLREKVADGSLRNGAQILQTAYIKASTSPPEMIREELEGLLAAETEETGSRGVPIYLFGNMIPEVEAFSLFEASGVRIIGEDLCTGSRLFSEIPLVGENPDNLMHIYARGLLNRPPCARTINESNPGKLAEDVLAAAKALQAEGVIGYTVKFCDPYIARLPAVRSALKKEGIPFLLLEGDCTIRTIEQQKTRIEAFIEMLR